jgi:translation initiation factor IF-3
MGRRFRRGPVRPERPEHRVNHRIRFPQIRVIDPEGVVLGTMSPEDGRAEAEKRGMDLVEVAANARPPVCRIMDYGKFKYERSKASTKSKQPSLKTVQLRPKTDDHDLETKLNRARRFLERGDKVRLVMRMRGRERGYPERWVALMREHFEDHLSDIASVAGRPSQQGRAISMLVEPN